MRQAKLKENGASVAAAAQGAPAHDDREVVDAFTVNAILDTGLVDAGDPVRGIRNALIASAALWAALAIVWLVAG